MKNIPRLRFPEFEKIWGENLFSDFYEFKTTNSYSRDNLNYEYGTFKNIHYGDIHTKFRTQFIVNNEEVPYINEDIDTSTIKTDQILKNGDLILADASEDYSDIGKSIEIINVDSQKVVAGLHTLHAKSKNGIYVGYGGFMMKSPSVRKSLMMIAQGTKVLGISSKKVSNIRINTPSLPEQQKIADFLTSVDKRIELLEKKKTFLETYKKGVMKKIFNQEIRFRDYNGRDFPDWEEKRLDEILEERNQQSPKSDNYPLMAFSAEKGISHKGERYNREFLVKDIDNKKYKKTEFGDFIYSSNNLETGSIGLNTHGSASISPVYSIFKTKKEFDFNFLGRYLVRKEFIYKMTRYRQGVMYGQWRIHESDFLKINDRFPCFDEQKVIGAFLLSIDSYINEISIVIDKTKTWEKGLLQKMFV